VIFGPVNQPVVDLETEMAQHQGEFLYPQVASPVKDVEMADESFSSDRQDVSALTSARELEEEEAAKKQAASLPACEGDMSQAAHDAVAAVEAEELIAARDNNVAVVPVIRDMNQEGHVAGDAEISDDGEANEAPVPALPAVETIKNWDEDFERNEREKKQ
jgi:hypothetical protein